MIPNLINFTFLKNFQEIVALLTFHGAKLDINKEYTSSSKETLPLYGGAEVDIKETFYVYEYNPQTSWVSLDYYKNYDHEQLMELQFDVVKKITGAKNVKKEDLHKLNINCYTGVQVHTDTGWPGYVYSEKRTEKNGGINLEIFKVDIDLQ